MGENRLQSCEILGLLGPDLDKDTIHLAFDRVTDQKDMGYETKTFDTMTVTLSEVSRLSRVIIRTSGQNGVTKVRTAEVYIQDPEVRNIMQN